MRDMCDKINETSPYRAKLAEQIQLFDNELINFKNLSDDLQTLQIDKIVDKFSLLYCALHLLREGLDHFSKLDCLQYFWMLHFEKNVNRGKEYLELISRIIK